jgi:hypothetical protein
MSRDAPPLQSTNAHSAAVTNSEVALTLLLPPSSASPALHRHGGLANLFRGSSKKRFLDLLLAGYSPAKKEGGRCTWSASISPHDEDAFADVVSSDEDEDKDYLPTPAYKIVRMTRPKKQDVKVTLDSNYLHFFAQRPLMGPRGTTIICYNSSAPRGASSFGQI